MNRTDRTLSHAFRLKTAQTINVSVNTAGTWSLTWALISVLCGAMIFLQSCRTVTNQSVSENVNGRFKVMVRTQEFNNSGTKIVDVCVANTVSHEFPDTKTSQCFLRGFDFAGLSVKWQGSSVIEVFFRSGRVTHFKNTAFAYPGGTVPEEFHTLLCDGCEPEPKYPHAGDTKR